MRFKYYLRGLGLGVLVTTCIFIVSIQIHGGIMTDDRVVARATEMGRIVPEESTESETEIQPVPEEENTIDYEDEPVIQENESSGMNEENGSNDVQNPNLESQNTQQDTDAVMPEMIALTITQGEICREIAEELQNKGMIDDVDAFCKFMYANGHDNFIQSGEYLIPMGADYELIATIITTKEE